MEPLRESGKTSGSASEPSAGQILRHLDSILKSPEFERTDRSRGLLEYLVNTALRGEGGTLKESVIGVKVFNRPADYDPKTDPVVRVTVGRLRSKLDKYYEREGTREPVRIVIPLGSYGPSFELANQVPEPAAANVTAPPTSAPRWKAVAAGASLLLLAVAIAGGWWWESRPAPPILDHLRPFLSTGSPNNIAFSPAGTTLAFDAEAPENKYRNIFVQALASNTARRLTNDQANCRFPVWSPDGLQIAFLRDEGSGAFAVFLMSANGENEHRLTALHDASASLSWSSDGEWLAVAEKEGKMSRGVFLISVRSGETRGVTNPPSDWRGDSLPAFSPDGGSVAFRRTTPRSGEEDLYMVPKLGGPVQRLTSDGRGISGFAFLRDGSLVFSSRREGSIRSLWWLAPGRSGLQRLTSTPIDAGPPAVSRDGKHFGVVVYNYDVNIWRVAADGNSSALPLIASELPDSSPQYSPDGKRVAFCSTRSGSDAIWVSNADGGNPRCLMDAKGTAIGSERWSPDGRQVVFEWHPAGKAEIDVIASDGGKPRALLADGYDNSVPSWSHDGSYVYFNSRRTGRPEIWRIPAAGGTPLQMTRQGAVAGGESPDGSVFYFFDFAAGADSRSLWKVPLVNGLPEGKPERVLTKMNRADWSSWVPVGHGIYHVRRKDNTAGIQYVDLASGQVRKIYDLQRPPAWGGGIAVSPDERAILFTQVDRDGSSIFVQ